MCSNTAQRTEPGSAGHTHEPRHAPALAQVCEDAARLLRTIRTPVGVIAVCGRARTGKSFILNQLLGRSTGFRLAHSHRPCTKGLWIWSRPVRLVGADGQPYHLVGAAPPPPPPVPCDFLEQPGSASTPCAMPTASFAEQRLPKQPLQAALGYPGMRARLRAALQGVQPHAISARHRPQAPLTRPRPNPRAPDPAGQRGQRRVQPDGAGRRAAAEPGGAAELHVCVQPDGAHRRGGHRQAGAGDRGGGRGCCAA